MSRPTFEKALRDVLSNSRMSRIVDGELPALWWTEALSEDKRDIEDIVDKLCKDLEVIIQHRILRQTKLRADMFLLGHFSHEYQAAASWLKFVKNINHYIKVVLNRINVELDPIVTCPIDRIHWEKGVVKTRFPRSMGVIQNIKLITPTHLRHEDVPNKPAYIQRILDVCEHTNFDYQPFVIQGKDGNRILALHLGCDWNDLVVGTWEYYGLQNLNLVLGNLAAFFFLVMGLCIWKHSQIESQWVSIPVLLISILSGVLGGVIVSLLITRICKPLKV